MDMRQLPSIDRIVRALPDSLPRSLRTDVARAAVAAARDLIASGDEADPLESAVQAARALERRRPGEIINATGVLLHTNLGRAPLDPGAADAARLAAVRYGNLEIDLSDGRRGGRAAYVRTLLRVLTGAEDALVLNNNAGALFLTLAALAAGRVVPVSRGELIEIGGSYRLPELMAASGAVLREIGTTNRTHRADYERALAEDPAMLLKVHPSNYRIAGFTDEVDVGAMSAIASEAGIPAVFDAGSGLLDARAPWLDGPPPAWLAGEPGVVQSLDAGADLVMFSGDKLLGGPQAGIVVGRADLVGRLASHPVARAMRIDGPSLAALSVTLDRYADGSAATLPFWAMATADDLEERAARIVEMSGAEGTVRQGASTVGAGSVPGAEVPSPVVEIRGDTDRRYLALLAGEVPVVARREEGALVVDPRTVFPDQEQALAAELARVCRS